MQQTAKKPAPENNNNMAKKKPAETGETALIISGLTPGNANLFIDERWRNLQRFTNHLIHRLQASLT